jgi:NTE family protein
MKTGLVLSGGGARGAYEAGVMRYLVCDLGPRIGGVDFPIICGASIGAIQGAWLAGHGCSTGSAQRLSNLWRELSAGQVFNFEALHLLRSPALMLRRAADRPAVRALVDARPMHTLIRSLFPAKALRQRLASGALEAFSVSATQVASGLSVRFVDHHSQSWRPWSSPPSVSVRPSRITAEHVLASAAIPFVFPPVDVDGRSHVDGSLRHNTPLTPALRLGAERILVLACKAPFQAWHEKAVAEEPDSAPNLFYLLGKAMNALMLDPVEQDLYRVELLNQILTWGEQTYGAGFVERLNAELGDKLGHPYRVVRSLMVRPREDLGRVAAASFREASRNMNRATRVLLSTIAAREGDEDADLLSYLLFDRVYTAQLEQLGWEDARDRELELASFFLDRASGR